ncbi:PH domain-containing protein [Actinokineospora sp. HUAS TT18]|uniref:PH domain-containing protein n=1 Tax=Actinokineospora sp. HUAS TT18 TaxID=3447451 RepID=UPI003F51C108
MSEQQIPSRLVFRIPGVAILAALLLAVCATPVVFAGPVFALLLVIPVAIIVWVIRVRTTADADGLVVRRLFGRVALPWDSLKGLRLTKRAGVRAVRSDDTEVGLPSVRVRHLPALSLVSRGRLDDPTEPVPTAETPSDVADQPADAPADAE